MNFQGMEIAELQAADSIELTELTNSEIALVGGGSGEVIFPN